MKLLGIIAAVIQAGTALAAPAFHAEGFLLEEGKEPRKVELLAATRESARYREPGLKNAPELEQPLNKGVTVFVSEPAEYTKAMDLYQARRYKEARALFAEVKERYRPLTPLDDSPATLAGYHELECFRKSGDLAGLAAALPALPRGPLTREFQQRQLELYVFWDAVRTTSWDRVEALAKEHANARLPGDQRAQIDFCHGLALEALKRPDEALVAFNSALTADGGTCEDITRQAALRILGIYLKDPDIQAALKKPVESQKLTEARAVAALFQGPLGAGAPLPAEFKGFSRPGLTK